MDMLRANAFFDFTFANLLHAHIGTEKHHFLGAFLDAGFFQHGAQRAATPVRIAYQAVEKARAVAAAFETGLQVYRIARHEIVQREFEFPVHHAGNAKPVAVDVDFWLAVMLHDIEVLVRSDVGSDQPRVLVVRGARAVSP